MDTNVLEQRSQFVRDFASGQWSMSELCERYGVTRPTGYKWVTRHRASGDEGLMNRSRAPHQCPHRTCGDLEALILAARVRPPTAPEARRLTRNLRSLRRLRSRPHPHKPASL